VDGELSPEQSAAVEAHLASCAKCAGELYEMRAVDNVTKHSVELQMPGKDFAKRIMGEISPSQPGLRKWQGPIAFLLVAVLTAVILIVVNRLNKPVEPVQPSADLHKDIIISGPEGPKKLVTPTVVDAPFSAPGSFVVELPHKARAILRGSVDVGWTSDGVHLKPAGDAAVYIVGAEPVLRDVFIDLPDGKIAGYGKNLLVRTTDDGWRVYAITGRSRVADKDGQNLVDILSLNMLSKDTAVPSSFSTDEIVNALLPLSDALPARPLLPCGSCTAGINRAVVPLPAALETSRAETAAGAGKGFVSALSVVGPANASLISLRHDGDKWFVSSAGKDKPLSLPENEKPITLIASTELGLMTLDESGNLFKAEANVISKESAVIKTHAGPVKQFAWDAWSGLLYICGSGGIVCFDLSYGAARWQEGKLRDVVGLAVTADGNLVCAGGDGAITVLEKKEGKSVGTFGPIGQAFILPPVVDSGRILALASAGRLVVIQGSESVFKDIPEAAGAENWGVRGDYVYFRKAGQWSQFRLSEAKVSPEGEGGSWAVTDIFGLLRSFKGGLYRRITRTADVPADACPLATPAGLLVIGETSSAFVPFLKAGR
jgi:hypothetical protein